MLFFLIFVIFALRITGRRVGDGPGEMPEWSIGPHSKCGVRATVPGVRIPLSPLNVLDRNGQQTDKKLQINDLWLFLLPESPASKTSKVR